MEIVAVYQLGRTGEDLLAYKWVLINIAISFTVLVIINILENQNKKTTKLKTSES